MLGARLEIPLLQTDCCSLPYLPESSFSSCCQQVWFLSCWWARFFPVLFSDLLPQQQPALALPQAVSRQEQRRLLLGEGSGMKGEGAWCRKHSPLPADKATVLETQYSTQGTRVTTSFPYSGKERRSGNASASCASYLGTRLLLARLHVQQTGCCHTPLHSHRACLLLLTCLPTCGSCFRKSHQQPLPAHC